MRILYHHRIASKDGQYVHVEELTEALRGLGHEVIVVGPAGARRRDFGSAGGVVPWLKKGVPGPCYELAEFAYSFIAYARLLAAVRRHRPDGLYERYNLFLPAGVWLKRRTGLPMLLEVNAPLFEERKVHDGISLRRLARWSEESAWRGADHVLVVTETLAEHVRRSGVPDERIEVVPNAINRRSFDSAPDAETAKRRLGLDGKLVLGFVGFLRDWHGLDRVVRFVARSRAADIVFLIVGDGPSRAGLERLARRLGVTDRVRFTGVVPREKIPEHIAAFDVALQPDVVEYASPLKIYEYLAVGRPVLAPAVRNILAVIVSGENGLLFERGDDASFGSALDRLCRDAGLRKRLGENARKTIAEKGMSWESNARRVLDLFRRLGVEP